jgi:hypothetical protein
VNIFVELLGRNLLIRTLLSVDLLTTQRFQIISETFYTVSPKNLENPNKIETNDFPEKRKNR